MEQQQTQRRAAVGILAHVDAGKTTLSEAMLYQAGAIRRWGRVDHGDAFLDTEVIERERGITIFSKLAVMDLGDLRLTLVDTPGHVDFSAETERTLAVLDYAVLVIGGADGVQAHTRTLWELLRRYRVPCFLFVNKMDLPGTDREALLREFRGELDEGCADLSQRDSAFYENAATLDEAALEEYLAGGALAEETLARLVAERKLFPVCFGSALRREGVGDLLSLLQAYIRPLRWPETFSARVYKIARDPQGARLSWLKVTGGTLRVKDALDTGGGESEKVDQIRLYSGEKYTLAEEAPAGTVCAVTGPRRTWAGQGLGAAAQSARPLLEPVLSYEALLPEGTDVHAALGCFRLLEEEDPQLHIVWNERLQKIQVRLMGEVQLEVLQRLLRERFDLAVEFGTAGIVYRETIAGPVEGVGHFEPLRHYAEVHLLLSPLPRGSGLVFDSILSEDLLDRSWQRLVLTHLAEKTHLGVLTGSPITDMRISLAAGAASVKHTEGGDFREATYRALRQGLMRAHSLLLEPWYDFTLTVPADQVGRAIADLSRKSARLDQPQTQGDKAVLTGSVPVSELLDYGAVVASYTRGRGSLSALLRGYEECHNAREVVSALGYEPERDLENTPDSVFCAHGAGFPVKWDEVEAHMHLESVLRPSLPEQPEPEEAAPSRKYEEIRAQDDELREIFERTYGKIRRRDILPPEERQRWRPTPPKSILDKDRVRLKPRPVGTEYLLVDGYNIIFAWEELRVLSRDSIDAARQRLMDELADMRGVKGCEVILVFDAYKVAGGTGSVNEYHGISVVYTKEAETADAYIEKTAHKLSRGNRVVVATSDGPEQMIILGAGALRMTAQELRGELLSARQAIRETVEEAAAEKRSRPVEEAFRRAAGKGAQE